MDDMMWVWVAIAAVVLVVIIVIVVIVGRRKGKERNRERAAELRSRAAADDQLISTREDRAGELEVEAEAARQKALSEYERAESLRAQAEESDEMAARATDEARVLADEAEQSRQSFEAAVAEHEETLREADRRDPDVHTDRHGNRIEDPERVEDASKTDHAETEPTEEKAESAEDAADPVEEEVVIIPVEERLDIDDDYSGDEFGEPDREYIDPVDHDRLEHVKESTPREDDGEETIDEREDQYLAEANRLDELNEAAARESNGATAIVAGSEDATRDEADPEMADGQTEDTHTTHIEPVTGYAPEAADSPVREGEDEYTEQDDETGNTLDPEVEYIDPADHDRLAESDEALLLENDDIPAGTVDSSYALAETTKGRDTEDGQTPAPMDEDSAGHQRSDHEAVDQLLNESAVESDVFATPEADEGPALDPYGNPVMVEEDKLSTDASELETHDEPRDEHGRRLDPYGNPIIEEPAASPASDVHNISEMPVDDPSLTDDADDDLPRDEQGRRLDPYGNPVPENLQ